MTTTITLVLGRLRAALLTACVLPLSTSYSLAEAFGLSGGWEERGKRPFLLGLYTLLILVGVVVAMLPDLPVMQMVLNLSLLGALLLPIMLFAMVYLVNQKRLMGSYTNGLVYKVIVSVLVGAVSALAVVYLITLVLSFFGSQIP